MNSKDKQIAWQGIFKGIMQQQIDPLKAEDLAYAINERLQAKYPLEEETQTAQKSDTQKPTRCPKCGKFSVYHNKGISKKSNAPYENYKCSNKNCDYIKWETTNYEQKRLRDIELKSMRQQEDLDIIEEEEYNSRLQENGF
jgi:transposase-like protein